MIFININLNIYLNKRKYRYFSINTSDLTFGQRIVIITKDSFGGIIWKNNHYKYLNDQSNIMVLSFKIWINLYSFLSSTNSWRQFMMLVYRYIHVRVHLANWSTITHNKLKPQTEKTKNKIPHVQSNFRRSKLFLSWFEISLIIHSQLYVLKISRNML